MQEINASIRSEVAMYSHLAFKWFVNKRCVYVCVKRERERKFENIHNLSQCL